MNLEKIFKIYFVFVMALSLGAGLSYFESFSEGLSSKYASVIHMSDEDPELGFQLDLPGKEGWVVVEKARDFVSSDSEEAEILKLRVAKDFDIEKLELEVSGVQIKKAILMSVNNEFKGKMKNNTILFDGLDGRSEYILHLEFGELHLGEIGKVKINKIVSAQGADKKLMVSKTFSVVR